MPKTGELQTKSALNLIVFGPDIEHLDLIEYVVVDLLRVKWNSFVRRSFYRQLLTFIFYFLLSTFCFVSRGAMPDTSSQACDTNDTVGNVADSIRNRSIDCRDHGPATEPAEKCIHMDLPVEGALESNREEFQMNNGNLSKMREKFVSSNIANDSGEQNVCKILMKDLDHCYLTKYDSWYKKVGSLKSIVKL